MALQFKGGVVATLGNFPCWRLQETVWTSENHRATAGLYTEMKDRKGMRRATGVFLDSQTETAEVVSHDFSN